MTIAKKGVRILNNLCKRVNSVRLMVLERHTMYIVRTLWLFWDYANFLMSVLYLSSDSFDGASNKTVHSLSFKEE